MEREKNVQKKGFCPVDANSDNLKSSKEAGEGAQGTQGSSKELYKWRECLPFVACDQRFS